MFSLLLKDLISDFNWYTAILFQMMTLGLPWPFLWWANLFPNASAWMKAYKYSIECSCISKFDLVNSAYPQHSGEQYRTIGPLVWWWSSDTCMIFLHVPVSLDFLYFLNKKQQLVNTKHRKMKSSRPWNDVLNTIIFLSFRTDRSGQTVQTL